jgi:PAS domain S-box-containing protein
MFAAQFKLGQKGMLLMLVILLLETIFFGTYFMLVQQAEEESKKQQLTKEVINKASRLMLKMYEAGDKVGKFNIHKEDNPELSRECLENYLSARREILKLIKWLHVNLEDQPAQQKVLGKIEENVKIGMELLENMRISAETKPHWEAMKFGLDQRTRLAPRIEELVRDMRDFMGEERAIEGQLPLLQTAKREQTKIVLVVGAVMNVFVVLLVLGFIRVVITNRLNVVIDNSDRLRDGEALHQPLNGTDEIDMLDGSFHDMVASLRGEEALLRSSENSVLAMISQMPAGLLVIDGLGRVEFANPMLSDMLGYEQEDLTDSDLTSLFTAGSGVSVPLFRWMKENSDGRVVEITALRKDGSTLPVEFSLADVSTEENEHRLAMVLDVTERHEMEKLRQAFVAMVSHELRTPLSSVSMFLELLGMGVFGKTNENVEKDLATTSRQTEQVIMLINDLLDLEKLEADKLELVKSESEVEDLVDKAVEAVATAVEAADILLLFEGSQEIVHVDPERIVQSLTKMLTSVIQLTPEGETVTIDVSADDAMLQIDIKVPALHIPEEQIETMFERFQQINLPNMPQGTWLGLGLALSRAIIQQHGGEVGLDVSDKEGSIFWMEIPKK